MLESGVSPMVKREPINSIAVELGLDVNPKQPKKRLKAQQEDPIYMRGVTELALIVVMSPILKTGNRTPSAVSSDGETQKRLKLTIHKANEQVRDPYCH